MSNFKTWKEFSEAPKYEDNLEVLANKASKEPWDFSDEFKSYDSRPYAILRRYIENTFLKINSESKVCFTESKKYASFNTGLVTDYLEDIYGFFEKHRSKDDSYYFIGFFKESEDAISTNFGYSLPLTANYFTSPEDLLYNPNKKLITRYDHILNDNRERWTRKLGEMNDRELRQTLVGAIQDIEKEVRNNYKLAIPMYRFDENRGNRIQLLLPLNISRNEKTDTLALVIDKVMKSDDDGEHSIDDSLKNNPNKVYIAMTCLELPAAYSNARLIVKPSSFWLNQAIQDGVKFIAT
jgi:hypothetical protein